MNRINTPRTDELSNFPFDSHSGTYIAFRYFGGNQLSFLKEDIENILTSKDEKNRIQ